MEFFVDIERHPWTHCNNLWLDLVQVSEVLDANQGTLSLPLIVNRKTVDPADAGSPAVVQLEGAIGAAVEVFEGARAIGVPRSRFLPVKGTAELLVLRSDVYDFAADARLVARTPAPIVQLDPDHYKLIDQFEARFPAGPPSLVEAETLKVTGDWTFGADVRVRGRAVLAAPADQDAKEPRFVPDGAEITDSGVAG